MGSMAIKARLPEVPDLKAANRISMHDMALIGFTEVEYVFWLDIPVKSLPFIHGRRLY
jgi:hypothetical protein